MEVKQIISLDFLGGHCEACGIDLRAYAYVKGESTGCSKRCVEAAYTEDMEEE